MSTPPDQPDVPDLLLALHGGDPLPAVHALADPKGPHQALMKALLADPSDGPVAQAFTLAWGGISANWPDFRVNLLRWYLTTEANGLEGKPARQAAHRRALRQVLALNPVGLSENTIDLCCAAARVALERGGFPGLRTAAIRLLGRLRGTIGSPTVNKVMAAIHAVDLSMLRPLVQAWPARPVSPDLLRLLNWSVGLLIEVAGIDPWMEDVLARQYRRDPQDPLSAQRQVQLHLHQVLRPKGFTDPLRQIRLEASDPNLRNVLQFGLWQAQNYDDDDLADWIVTAFKQIDPGWQMQAEARQDLPPHPTDLPPGADLEAIANAAQSLAGADFRLDGPWTVESLTQAFDRLSSAATTQAMPRGWGHADVLAAIYRLIQIDRAELVIYSHFNLAPYARGLPAYGLIDLDLLATARRGLVGVIAALAKAGAEWFLANDPPGGLGPLMRLIRLQRRYGLQIGQDAEVADLQSRVAVAGVLEDVLQIERDALALHRGDLEKARRHTPFNLAGSQAFPFLDRPEWSVAEGVAWQELSHEPGVTGAFEVAWPDGRVESVPHCTPQGRITLAAVPGLRLVSEDFLVGPKGHALRPDVFHTSAEFPFDQAPVAAAGRRGLRLRPLDKGRCDTPVLLLEAFEALRWRNYYHWVIPILTRIALAQERGMLDGRLLVVPEGLSGWMTESLRLMGLGPERLLPVRPGHGLQFSDALLMSSVEIVSGDALHALRARLMGDKAQQPLQADGPAVFLSRKGHKLRRMINEAEVEAMAAEMGFQVVAPQDLGIAGQIDLMARARGVAAVEGAALTNLAFAPPGLRALAFCCQNDMMPVFNDLSVVLGQHHRKLAGAAADGAGFGSRFQPPFQVDLDLARASLAWVLGDKPRGPRKGGKG